MYNDNDSIIKKAHQLLQKAGSSDPALLARHLNLQIRPVPFRTQKGVYKILAGQRFIFIKEDLDPVMQKIVLLHEIGHDQLHQKEAAAFLEQDLFGQRTNRMEYEANFFAAELSLPDDELLEYIYRGMGIAEIASAMKSDQNLIAIKTSDMIRRGYSFHAQEHRNDFLK